MFNFGTTSQKQQATSSPVQLDLYSTEQEQLFKQLAGIVSGGLSGNIAAYPKSMYVTRQPEESQYFELANLVSGQSGARLEALRNVLSGNAAYDINPEITRQYFANSIEPLMAKQFYGKTLPGISESYAGPGYWSSARALAEANAKSDYAMNLGATEANLVYADELARRASLESAANRQASSALPSVEALMSDVGTAGQYARSIKEEQTLADYQRWLSGETVEGVTPVQNNPFLQLAFQFLGLQPFTYGTQSQSTGSASGFKFGLELPKFGG